jgi:GDPmannose 4,6-dehydratase
MAELAVTSINQEMQSGSDFSEVNQLVQQQLERMYALVDKIHAGQYRGATGEVIQDVVNIGVGGSDLGPLMVTHALSDFKVATTKPLNVHFVSTMDGSQLSELLHQLRPETTLFIISSKSFGTIDTLSNAQTVRILGLEKKTKIYQASTSELYGLVQEVPQKETTPFYPRSPYGVAKQYGFWITKNYRESYGMFAVNGILFNHESERRGETFVTRKITLAAARIAQGFQDKLYLGNLDALRDWGYAKDYVECMWLILQHDVPEDFVIATGEYHTVREFATLAFKEVGITLRWEGNGVDEKGIDTATGRVLVEVDARYFRPAEVEQLLGDPTKARTLLGWNPTRTSFPELVRIMAAHDMKFVRKLHLRQELDK